MKIISYLGQKFNRLLILKQWQVEDYRQRVLAQCDCGVLKEYRLGHLKSGNTKSCGCSQKERVRERFMTHGLSDSPVYGTWDAMIQRCTNSKASYFKDYGGRGIKVCDRWLKFENFYEDMGDKPKGLELDRIDNNKSYLKENCHWTTHRKNDQNTRVSKYWFIYGKRYGSCTEAAEVLGVRSATIQNWCNGYISSKGVPYPPKPGCHSELKYNNPV